MTPERWLEAHAYLKPVAELFSEVERALAGVDAPDARPPQIPDWESYREDFLAGVPLLASPAAGVDLEPCGESAVALVAALASSDSGSAFAEEVRALDLALRSDPDSARRVAALLSGDDAPAPGLLRFLAWTAAARRLRPVTRAFAGWRDEERWMRRYCPLCGSLPAMAQLVGVDPGRMRFLACGRCGTRWRFRRTGCPFCENDSQRLAGLALEGEPGLRIDHCESCHGYLKTYVGQGDESLLLADWSTLHLDLVARDRGLERRAASLYDIEAALPA